MISLSLFGQTLNIFSQIGMIMLVGLLGKNAVLIGVNDSFGGDTDFQDMIISARSVPLPLMAPGLAVAGAFFAYRRKRQTRQTVA